MVSAALGSRSSEIWENVERGKKRQSGDLAPLGEIKMYDGDVTGSARICASPESLFPSTARDLAGTTQCSSSKTENIWEKKNFSLNVLCLVVSNSQI